MYGKGSDILYFTSTFLLGLENLIPVDCPSRARVSEGYIGLDANGGRSSNTSGKSSSTTTHKEEADICPLCYTSTRYDKGSTRSSRITDKGSRIVERDGVCSAEDACRSSSGSSSANRSGISIYELLDSLWRDCGVKIAEALEVVRRETTARSPSIIPVIECRVCSSTNIGGGDSNVVLTHYTLSLNHAS